MSDMISAICVSKPSRFGFLQRAVYNFAMQDYENCELLIAVMDGEYRNKIAAWLNTEAVRAFGSQDKSIKLILSDKINISLSALEAFKQSTGNYIAVWSDDNLSHSTRLSSQLKKSKESATVVEMSFYYFYDTDELFVTDYRQPGGTPVSKCAVSSLIVSRDDFCCEALLHGNPRSHWPAVALKNLAAVFPAQKYRHLSDKEDGLLFMQVVHSDNQRGIEYHRTQGSRLPLTWTREQVLDWSHEIDEILAGYVFPNEVVDVSGKDAAACTISGSHIRQWPLELESVF